MFTKEQYAALFAAMRDCHMFADDAKTDAFVTSTLQQVINIMLNDDTAAHWMDMFNVTKED